MGVTLIGKLICTDEHQARIVKKALPRHIALTLQEPGCLSFNVTPNAQNPLVWDVHEQFATRADFDAHQSRTRDSAWGQLTRDIPRDYTIAQTPDGVPETSPHEIP